MLEWWRTGGVNKTCRDGPGTVLSETVTMVSLSAARGPSRLFVPTISLKVTVYTSGVV